MTLPKICWKVLLITILFAGLGDRTRAEDKTRTVTGYVLDSACVYTKNLTKPVSPECAVACAKAGSPLVILADSGTIYWPIAETIPATGQNEKLLKFAGQKVTATGKVFARGGSHAIVVEKIEPAGAGR